VNINIVMGFFLPMPPDAGGATEKSWHQLSLEFAKRGHKVTIISREWAGWPDTETRDGVQYLRLKGFSHTKSIYKNIFLDALWSIRVFLKLPIADITVVNCITLPLFLGLWKRNAGKLVVMPGRMPKGQFHIYHNIDCILSVSSSVSQAILRETKRFEHITQVVGYPIDWHLLSPKRSHNPPPFCIGYIGRIHKEKGLDLIVEAATILSKRQGLPPWSLLFCGPRDISEGGSGETYCMQLQRKLARILPPDSYSFKAPVFSSVRLSLQYNEVDIFCYPSMASKGETFGVAVAEAMAAGAVPVVSDLPCFKDFVFDQENGLVFNHSSSDAAMELAKKLELLLSNSELRRHMSENARASVCRYDYPQFASRLLADFATLALSKR
jgi:glycosyltransferase involved in cell wall biosynthesis